MEMLAPGNTAPDWSRTVPEIAPTPLKRQVLNYHNKRRRSSPRYESIRAKYPNW
jgi:hypothetical protein